MNESEDTNIGLPVADEVRIVALIAKGLTYQQIREDFKQQGKPLAVATIVAVKKRNAPNLSLIKHKLQLKEVASAANLHGKAHNLLNKRLESYEKRDELLKELDRKYADGEITEIEFEAETKRLHRLEPSIPELVSISREMHIQQKDEVEPDKPDAQEDLHTLVEAIKSGDSVTLERIVFNADSEPSEGPSARVVPSGNEGAERKSEPSAKQEDISVDDRTAGRPIPEAELAGDAGKDQKEGGSSA